METANGRFKAAQAAVVLAQGKHQRAARGGGRSAEANAALAEWKDAVRYMEDCFNVERWVAEAKARIDSSLALDTEARGPLSEAVLERSRNTWSDKQFHLLPESRGLFKCFATAEEYVHYSHV